MHYLWYRLSVNALWYLHLIQNLRYYLLARDIAGLGLIAQSYAVAEHIVGHGSHILWNHVSAALDRGVGTAGLSEVDACSRTSARR